MHAQNRKYVLVPAFWVYLEYYWFELLGFFVFYGLKMYCKNHQMWIVIHRFQQKCGHDLLCKILYSHNSAFNVFKKTTENTFNNGQIGFDKNIMYVIYVFSFIY